MELHHGLHATSMFPSLLWVGLRPFNSLHDFADLAFLGLHKAFIHIDWYIFWIKWEEDLFDAVSLRYMARRSFEIQLDQLNDKKVLCFQCKKYLLSFQHVGAAFILWMMVFWLRKLELAVSLSPTWSYGDQRPELTESSVFGGSLLALWSWGLVKFLQEAAPKAIKEIPDQADEIHSRNMFGQTMYLL